MKNIAFWAFAALLFVISCGPQKESRKLFDSGDYRGAISQLRAELAADSTDVASWTLLGRSYEKVGEADSAIWAYEQGFSHAPGNGTLRGNIVRLRIARAQEAREAGEFRASLKQLERAEELAPKQFDVPFEKARTYLAAGYLDKASSELARAGELSSKDPRIETTAQEISRRRAEAEKLFQRGKKAYDRRRWEAAIATLEKAVELNREHKEAKYHLHMARGRRLYRKGSVSALWDAITEFGFAANLHPESGEPHYFMGLAYEKKDRKDFSMPVEVYQKAIEVEPNGPYAAKARKRIRYLTEKKKKLEKFWGRKIK